MRTLKTTNAVKTTAVAAFDEQVHSGALSFKGCAYASARAQAANAMFGLNTDPLTDANFTSIDFAFYTNAPNTLAIYEGGVAFGTTWTWAAGDLLEIIYDGVNVTYRQNGIVRRTLAVAAGLTLFFDSSFYGVGELRDLRFGPTITPAVVPWVASAGISLTGTTTQQRAFAAAAEMQAHTKVQITDSDGVWRDVSAAIQGEDWLNGGTLEESADGNSQRFTLSLMRDMVGFQLLSNPEFSNGSLSQFSVYDNGASGSITLTTEADVDAPSGFRLKIVHANTGTPSPGIGGINRSIGPDTGVYAVNKYHRGARIIWRIIANIPVGATINYASNAIGAEETHRWLTSQQGTGTFSEYLYEQVIGTTGSFSTTGFFYLTGARPLTWYIRLLTATDMTTTLMTSLAPLRTDSAANTKPNGTYAAIVNLNRKWRVYNAITAPGVVPVAADFEEVGNGFYDRVAVNDEPAEVRIEGRDAGAVLLDGFIRTKRTYGSVGGVDMATIVQQIIDDNAADNGYSGITVAGGLTGFLMNPFELDVGPLLPQINDVASKDGRVARYRYNAADVNEFVLWKPNRTATVEDFALAPDEYLSIPQNELDLEGVKTIVKIRFWDTASGTIHEIVSPTPETSAAITEFGKRYMEIDLSANGQVNSDAKALNYADNIRLDLQTPALAQTIESFGLWWVQLGDYVRTAANRTHYDTDQFGGVMGFTHAFGAGTWKTTVRLKGKPAGRYTEWLRLATGGPDAALVGPTLTVNALENTNDYQIAWDGDNVLLSIDGAAYVTPPASPITATRNAAGGFAKVYTFNAYKNGQEVTQSIIVSPKRATGAATADFQQIAESQTSNTSRLTGAVGPGGAGPLQYRTRIDFNGATGTWSAWAAFPSGGGTFVDIVTARALFYPKILIGQTRDANLFESQPATVTITGKFASHAPTTGTIDPVVPMFGGFVPFEYGSDTADGIIPTTTKDFIRQDQIDTSDRRITAVKRNGVVTESVDNMFKRGSNDAGDVVTTTARTFVDPSTATQVDASGRIVGVYRLGVIEPVNNLVKFGDALGATTMSSLTLNGSTIQQLTLQGSPTAGLQMFVGSSSVYGVHGSIVSSGAQFISYNAYQNTASVDSWTQSLGSIASGLFEVRPDGFGYYVAAVGKAVGNKATFWGAALFQVTGAGALSTAGAITSAAAVGAGGYFVAMLAGVEKGYFGVANAVNNLITGSAVGDMILRVAVSGKSILFSTDNGGSAGMRLNPTSLIVSAGPVSSSDFILT